MDINRGGVSAVGGRTTIVDASFSRPANTTAYAAGDAVSDDASSPTTLEFANVGRINGGTGLIVGAKLIDSANQSTLPNFELWVFDTEPTAMEDNAAFDPTDAEAADVVGIVQFSTNFIGDETSGAGGNVVFQSDQLNFPFECGAASTSLWGQLVARNAYTPVSAETFTIRLDVVQD